MAYQTISVTELSESIWTVSIKSGPVNLVTPTFVTEMADFASQLASSPTLRVVIFESSVEHFFLNHFDLTQAAAFPGGTETPLWVEMILQMTKAPVITIASIRGRTRGGGNEFSLACDLRYASREKALFGQPEVATGIVPGGGATERLPALIGRDRALEMILGSDDFDATTAESYGLVTRAIDDAELDAFVRSFASRLSHFSKPALAKAKAMVNRVSLPSDTLVQSAYSDYFQSLGSPDFRARMPKLAARFAEVGPDLEVRLGHHLGELR